MEQQVDVGVNSSVQSEVLHVERSHYFNEEMPKYLERRCASEVPFALELDVVELSVNRNLNSDLLDPDVLRDETSNKENEQVEEQNEQNVFKIVAFHN